MQMCTIYRIVLQNQNRVKDFIANEINFVFSASIAQLDSSSHTFKEEVVPSSFVILLWGEVQRLFGLRV